MATFPAADAPQYPEGFEQAYSKGEGQSQSGSFTAPFPGYHGWYLMNLEEGATTVRLKVSGYWKEHKEMYRAVDGKVINVVEFKCITKCDAKRRNRRHTSQFQPSIYIMPNTRLLIITTLTLFGAPPIHAKDQPNMLFIAIDDLNDWVGY